jgi:glycosyltransferase involved in cell wall biosynthesis
VAHILINGISAKSSGGQSILTNFLTMLNSRGSAHDFTVIVPNNASYEEHVGPRVRLLPMPRLSKTVLLPAVNALVLPRLIRYGGYDLVLNLADIPIPTETRQVFLFDWSYAAYPESIAWQRAGCADSIKRRSKLHLFRRYLHFVDIMIAQGPAIRDRLQRLYGMTQLRVIPNAVALDNLSAGESHDFALGAGFKLLCLSQYYSHKNLEVLIDVAELIRERSIDLKIILTIEAAQGPGASCLIEAIADRNLGSIIVNVGPVPMRHVPSLYQQTDALLLPTLLESFSGTYVEAMFHGKPIFTSGYEFAVDVCQDAAFYFDPLNAHDILRVILQAIENPEATAHKIATGRKRLDILPDWAQAFDAYIALIDSTLKN